MRRLIVTQMKQGDGKFVNRPVKTKTKEYAKYYVYIPIGVATDTSFPFKPEDRVKVTIVDGTVVLSRE